MVVECVGGLNRYWRVASRSGRSSPADMRASVVGHYDTERQAFVGALAGSQRILVLDALGMQERDVYHLRYLARQQRESV